MPSVTLTNAPSGLFIAVFSLMAIADLFAVMLFAIKKLPLFPDALFA